MISLTYGASAATLCPLPHCSTGLASRNQTAQAAIMRFFYARKLLSTSSLCRTGQALARVAGYVWPVCQPVQSGTMIGIVLSGLKLITNEVNIMTNRAQKPAESSQAPGKKTICQNLTFDQATSLVIEIPTAVVKFSHMEVSL